MLRQEKTLIPVVQVKKTFCDTVQQKHEIDIPMFNKNLHYMNKDILL